MSDKTFDLGFENIIKMSILIIFWVSLGELFLEYTKIYKNNKIKLYLFSLIISSLLIIYLKIKD